MIHERQAASELDALRFLCDETKPRAARQQALESIATRIFSVPEHEIVFGSIRALFSRGPISIAQLGIHLTNRGFPDTELEKYFQPPSAADNDPGDLREAKS